MADLNGDGLPDIYDVNYLEGDALTRICPNGPCGPHNFPAQQDRLLLNWGDGTFRDVTAASGTGDPRWSVVAVFFDYPR